MSLADNIYIDTCRNILFTGDSTEGFPCRAIWEDTGEKAYTIKKFGVINRYNLQEEFPAITIRKTYIKSAIDEILWIYQKRSTDVRLLNSKIWDQWTDKNHTIGRSYGYQIGRKNLVERIEFKNHAELINYLLTDISVNYHYIDSYIRHDGTYILQLFYDESEQSNPQNIIKKVNADRNVFDNVEPGTTPMCIELFMDQINYVLHTLKTNPTSRRIMTNMYNHHDSYYMMLQPCAYSCLFNVSDDGSEKPVLNMILNQRSQDMLVAGNWNVVQYAALLMMVAHSVDMIPGELIHVIGDCHIYDRHIPIVKDMIENCNTYDAPIVTFNPGECKNFFEYTTDMFEIQDYKYGKEIKNIPVAK